MEEKQSERQRGRGEGRPWRGTERQRACSCAPRCSSRPCSSALCAAISSARSCEWVGHSDGGRPFAQTRLHAGLQLAA